MRTIAFFNNKGGVGKTSMVYHLAWMFHDLGHSVLAADLDPQSNLTSIFLDEADVEKLWPVGKHPHTILGSIDPLIESLGFEKVQAKNWVEISSQADISTHTLSPAEVERCIKALRPPSHRPPRTRTAWRHRHRRRLPARRRSLHTELESPPVGLFGALQNVTEDQDPLRRRNSAATDGCGTAP